MLHFTLVVETSLKLQSGEIIFSFDVAQTQNVFSGHIKLILHRPLVIDIYNEEKHI